MRIRKTYKRRSSRVPEMDAVWLGGEAFLGGSATLVDPDPPAVETTGSEPPSISRLDMPSWIWSAVRWIGRIGTR